MIPELKLDKQGRSIPAPTTPEHVDRMTQNRGWWHEQLVLIESLFAGRWEWWYNCLWDGFIGDRQIPQIQFCSNPHCTGGGSQFQHKWANDPAMQAESGTMSQTAKELVDLIRSCMDYGNTQVRDIVPWWLWAMGDQSIKERPVFRTPETAVRLYQGMGTIARLLAHPADWGAYVLSQLVYMDRGSAAAWFPTPMCLVNMMTRMVIGEGDHRFQSVHEPCCGTGGMLLEASNHSLDLSGGDIDLQMVHWCRFSAYLYMPWVVAGQKKYLREFKSRDQERATVKPATGNGVRVRNVPRRIKIGR